MTPSTTAHQHRLYRLPEDLGLFSYGEYALVRAVHDLEYL